MCSPVSGVLTVLLTFERQADARARTNHPLTQHDQRIPYSGITCIVMASPNHPPHTFNSQTMASLSELASLCR